MLINRSHSHLIILTLILFVVSTVGYLVYACSVPHGPSGGSWQGMLFGFAGAGCMLYAGLLSGRKKFPGRRLGTTKSWLRGHIWFGLLSVPLIFFHAGFRFGGPVEMVLMAVFLIVIVSGIYGLILQQALPRYLSSAAPAQAIFEQIPVACERLRRAVDEEVTKACEAHLLAAEEVPVEMPDVSVTRSMMVTGTTSMSILYSADAELWNFYQTEIDPFLSSEATHQHPMANSSYALTRISQYRGSLPRRFAPALAEIQAACDERRQLLRQARIHHWLHHWLYWHIPLSLSLLILSILHIVMSVYY